MLDIARAQAFQESKIEHEPILGSVLVLAGGRIQPLTYVERVMASLGLTDAKRLEAKYLKSAKL